MTPGGSILLADDEEKILKTLSRALREDGHPPLYYYLLHVWTGWFGTSGAAVRSLSGVVAVAALPLAWALGRRLGGPRTAALATVLLATSPFAIRYATEARTQGWLRPRAIYGYFPAGRDGDEVVVFDPADQTKEIGRFAFPRQEDREQLCLADFFRPLDAPMGFAANVKLAAVPAEIAAVSRDAAVVALPLEQPAP